MINYKVILMHWLQV
jgi:hypothetical protein